MKERKFGCFTSLWTTLIAPILVGIVLAYFAGRVVIQITGFQINTGLTIIITLVFFIVIVISFFLGMGYLIFLGASLLLRTEMPLIYRVATNLLLKPSIWIYSRFFVSEEDREADKQDIAESKSALAEYHERVD